MQGRRGARLTFHNISQAKQYLPLVDPECCMQKGAFTSVRLTLESAEIAGELHGTDVILLSKLDPFNVSSLAACPASSPDWSISNAFELNAKEGLLPLESALLDGS